MVNVASIGEALIDFTYLSSDNEGYPTMAAHPGGAPANFLAALTKMGAETFLYSKLGDDTFGNLLLDTLRQTGISTKGIVVDPDVFTTLAFVTLDEKGDREFSFARKPGADTCLKFSELDLSIIDRADAFHFGTLSFTDEPSRSTAVQAVEYAKSRGKLITFDPNIREPLWKNMDEAVKWTLWGAEKADVVKISREEVLSALGYDETKGAEKLIKDYGVQLVFVTMGADGCYFSNGKASGYVENYNNVKTIDTTGAGDIFGGSAVYGVLASGKAPKNLTEDEIRDIADYACAAASLSTERHGGIQSVPDRAQVDKLRRCRRK